ncbi:hypothetical protein [Demequina sp.]|uniref:hypothetical protein n=1 Tax=Demequina sp. TaxID=2050685 RepID=UPI0025C14BEA|nr:hypothetical protein [Demequina sp.]
MAVVMAGMESEPWLERLRESLSALRRHNAAPVAVGGDVTFEVLLGAYCARRLREIGAVDRAACDRLWPVRLYGRDSTVSLPGKAFVVGANLLDAYDLTVPTVGALTSWDLLNYLMHSTLLLPVTDGPEYEPGVLIGLLFTSDRRRDEDVIDVRLTTLERLLSLFAEEAKSTHAEASRVMASLVEER